MKRYSYIYILVSVILGVVNIKYFNTNKLAIFSILELFYIVYLVGTKKVEKAFIYQIIFTLSSAAFPQNLELLEVGFKMNTYSKMKLIGPVSLSYVGLLLIFAATFFKKTSKQVFEFNKYNQFYYSLIYLTLVSTFIGISGLILDTYSFSQFIGSLVYSLNLIVYLYLIKKIFFDNIKKVEEILISLLIAAPVTTIILNILGFTGRYGGVDKYSNVDIFEYSAVLLLSVLYNKKYFLEVVAGIISILLGKSIYNGKGIMCVAFVLVIFIIKTLKNIKSNEKFLRKRSKVILIFGTIIFIFSINYILKNFMGTNKNLLITHKITQVLDLFKIFNLDNLNQISHSPRVRIASILNTSYHYYISPIFLIFGTGFGGYFRDYLRLFPKLESYDFSKFEIDNNIFFSAHDSLPSIYLTNGICGVIFILYWMYNFFKRILENQWATISFLWISLVFSFNHHLSILASLTIFLCLSKIKK